MSHDIPESPERAKGLGNVNYSDKDGFHVVLLFEVDDSKLAEILKAQGERNLFPASRAERLNLEMQAGLSQAEGVPIALNLIPK